MAKAKKAKENLFPELDQFFAEEDKRFREAFKEWDAAVAELCQPFSIEPWPL